MRSILSCLLLSSAALAQGTQIPIPAFTNTFASTVATRGFYFQAPVPIIIDGLRVPDETGSGIQNVEVFVDTVPPPAFAASVNPMHVFYAANVPSAQIIPTSILVNPGEWVTVLGACGTTTMQNSYGPTGAFQSTILGQPVTLTRAITQFNINTTGGNQPISSEVAGSFGRVEVYVASPVGFATATPFGTGCGRDILPASFYELFNGTTSTVDLANTSWSMFLSGGSYVVVPVGSGIVPPTVASTAFTDDQTTQFPLPGPMQTSIGTISDIWVNSNGWVSLESTTNTAWTENTAELLNQPFARVCALWDDFNPALAGSGQIHVETIGAIVYVTYNGIYELGTANANTFQIAFDTASGTIEVNYGTLTVLDALVGFSPGNGATDPGSVDLSTVLTSGGITLGTGRPNLGLAAGVRPVIGGPTATAIAQNIAPASVAGAFLLGISGFNPGVPLDLVGMTGCSLYTNAELGTVPFAIAGSTATFSATISAASTALTGAHIFLQAATITPGANPLGVVMSNGLDWLVDVN